MMLKTLIFSISTAGVILGAIDYFGYAAVLEERVDRARDTLGRLVKRAGIFKPVIVVADWFLPESATSPVAKVGRLVMMGVSAPIFALILLFLYALLKFAEYLGLVEDAMQALAIFVVSIMSLSYYLLAPLQTHMNENAFTAFDTLLSMAIVCLIGYVFVSITIILIFMLLNLIYRFFDLLDRPPKGTVATFGFGIGMIGYALGFFVEC